MTSEPGADEASVRDAEALRRQAAWRQLWSRLLGAPDEQAADQRQQALRNEPATPERKGA